MKKAALILGIIGGIAGIFGSLFALFIGGISSAFGSEDSTFILVGGLIALALSILSIIGAALVSAKPKLGGIFMIIAGVGGLICIFVAYLIAAPLLIIGGILALKEKEE